MPKDLRLYTFDTSIRRLFRRWFPQVALRLFRGFGVPRAATLLVAVRWAMEPRVESNFEFERSVFRSVDRFPWAAFRDHPTGWPATTGSRRGRAARWRPRLTRRPAESLSSTSNPIHLSRRLDRHHGNRNTFVPGPEGHQA